MAPDTNTEAAPAPIQDLTAERRALARFGFELTNQVQGRGPDVWFLCAPNCLPFRVGSVHDVRRVLALHEMWLARGNRARIESWKAQKLRYARMGGRPTYDDRGRVVRRGR